jgi:hypothetical protein
MLNILDNKGNANQNHIKIPVRNVIIKNTMTNSGEDVGEKEPSYTTGGNVN